MVSGTCFFINPYGAKEHASHKKKRKHGIFYAFGKMFFAFKILRFFLHDGKRFLMVAKRIKEYLSIR
jgi:hypothetical protein